MKFPPFRRHEIGVYPECPGPDSSGHQIGVTPCPKKGGWKWGRRTKVGLHRPRWTERDWRRAPSTTTWVSFDFCHRRGDRTAHWIPAQGGGPYCSRNSLSQISASRDSAPRWVSCSFCRRGGQRTAAVTALAPPTGAGRRALLSGISARVIPLVQFLPNRTPLVAPRSSC